MKNKIELNINDLIEKLEEEFKFKQKLQAETKFEEAYELSSLNTILFISFIHEEYCVALNIGSLRKIKTVKDLYDLINNSI